MREKERFHILCVRFSSLGDIILHSSIVSQLKERWGDRVYISYLTSESFSPLIEGHPHIDDVHAFPRKNGLSKLFNMVRNIDDERKIDLILDFHATLRSLAIRFRFPQIPRMYVDKRTVERSILTTLKLDFLSMQGEESREKGYGELLLERNIRDFEGVFNYKFSRNRLSKFVTGDSNDLQISSCAQTYKEELVKFKMDSPYIAICPSASFPEKRWPSSNFSELLEGLLKNSSFKDFNFLILAGPEDSFCDVFNVIVDRSNGRVVNLQGKTSLVETTYIVKHAYMVIGNDTGVPHIAEAVGTPAVFILGPTGEEFGFYPHLNRSKAVFKKIWCRPCTTNGKGNCIRSERYCLTHISYRDVMDKVLDVHNMILNG